MKQVTKKIEETNEIIRLVASLFGARITLRFILKLPIEAFHGSENLGGRALGSVKIKVHGIPITFERPDIGLINEIVIKRSYELLGFTSIDRDATIVDLGANIGVFTLYGAARSPSGKIISVEPDPTNFQQLRRNVLANKFSNIELVQKAISNVSGPTRLFLVHPTGHTIMKSSGAYPVITCESLTMDDLMRSYNISHIDFLKIDIEGAEFLLFDDLHWLESVEQIVMEVHTKFGNPATLIDKLRARGFNVQVRPHTEVGPIIYAKSHNNA